MVLFGTIDYKLRIDGKGLEGFAVKEFGAQAQFAEVLGNELGRDIDFWAPGIPSGEFVRGEIL